MLVFVQSKDRAEQLRQELQYEDYKVDAIHANMTDQEVSLHFSFNLHYVLNNKETLLRNFLVILKHICMQIIDLNLSMLSFIMICFHLSGTFVHKFIKKF